jgi:aldose 1-epimerase
MPVIDLTSAALSLRVSTAGGLVLGFWQESEGARVPLFRPAASDDADALSSSCYPLVPFGNRVKDNRFLFEREEYRFTPNAEWDRHYLHGDGWQSEWSIVERTETSVELSLSHQDGRTPYRYRAVQRFALDGDALRMALSVENRGVHALPFGLGWHPYFPLTPQTTLLAPARKFWTEVEDWLPGEQTDIPADADFNRPSALPHRWVNNGYEDWNGRAAVTWPERSTRLILTADSVFRHAFVFVSDTTFDPAFKRDYFCFEPMTHLANGHNLPDLGGLRILRPGESLTGGIELRPETI